MQNLVRRAAVAAVGIPAVLASFYAGGWVLGALIAGAAMLGCHEFYELARARGDRPFPLMGMACSAGLVALATLYPSLSEAAPRVVTLLVAFVLVCSAAAVWLRWPGGSPLGAVGSTLTGVLYVGLPLAFVPLLRELPGSSAETLGADPWHATTWVVLPLLVTWAGDTAAYGVGSLFGRHRIAPSVSPGKTVEGALAGLLGSAAVGAWVVSWAAVVLPELRSPAVTGALLGALVGLGGQVGDLAESVLKREAGVKDSGRLLPGHGGMLDRLDALLFAFPLTWLLLASMGVTS
jgi:phosphatidate cytidylyltransferase